MSTRLRLGHIEVSQHERRVWRHGVHVPLGARAFDVLNALIEDQSEVIPKHRLLARVWPKVVVEENNLTVQISALRKALGADLIVTVPRRGYKLAVEVVRPGQAAATPGAEPASLQLPDKPSVAVLPFANLSEDSSHDWFIDGIVEDVITELSRYPDLFVIARNSSFTYKGKSVDVREVGRELGVRYVVQGSVRLIRNRIRMTAQLIDASTGLHLWADKQDQIADKVVDVQEELTRAVVASIAPHIELSEARRVHELRGPNHTGYELATRAWATCMSGFRTNDRAARDAAIRTAHQALQLEPDSRLALRALAMASWQDVLNHTAESMEHAHAEGMRAIERALAIDHDDEWAHALRGMLLAARTEGRQGLAELQRAHRANPNNAFVMAVLGFMEATNGQPEPAKQHISSAMRLSPKDPLQYMMLSFLGWAHFAAKEYALAAGAARRSLDATSTYAPPRLCLALCLAALGELDMARQEWRNLERIAPAYAQARVATGYTMAADPDYRARRNALVQVAAGLAPAPCAP